MTTKEFAIRMNRVLENAKYFSMIGFHCSVSMSIESGIVELTVYYDDAKDEDFIKSSSDLIAKPSSNGSYNWITLS